MGTVYTRDIKRIAEELYEKFKDEVSIDFNKNKELVAKYVDFGSKKIRNRIAGYLTRYAKRVKRLEEKKEENG